MGDNWRYITVKIYCLLHIIVIINQTTYCQLENFPTTCNITVIPFYDNIIHWNVSWDTGETIPEALDIEKHASEQCSESYNRYYIENVPQGSYKITNDHMLTPNCSYTLNFSKTDCFMNYTLPDCIDEYCLCIEEHTPIDLRIRDLRNYKYNLTWTYGGPYTIKNILFRYLHDNTYHNLSYGNMLNRNISERINSAIIDISKIESKSNFGKIEGIFTNERNCIFDKIVAIPRIIKPDPPCIQIESFYNKNTSSMYLNVSWWPENIIPDNVDIERLRSLNCEDFFHRLPLERNSTSGYVIISHDMFVPNCTYNVSLNESCKINYTIPVCFDNYCDCKFYTTNVKLKIKPIQNNKYELSWNYNGSYILKNLTFRFIHDYTNYTLLPYEQIVKPISSHSNFAIVDISNIGKVGTTGEIEGIFMNNMSCMSEAKVKFDILVKLHGSEIYFFVFVIMAVIVLPTLGCVYVYYLKSNKNSDPRPVGQILTLNPIYGSCYISCDDKYELAPASIKILQELDRGAFGIVYLGKVFNLNEQLKGWTNVAAKMLRDKATDEAKEDFLSEMETLKKIGIHPNIVALYGYCTLREPYIMVMEYIPCGSLHKYLLNLRNQWEVRQSVDSVFTNNTNSSSDCTYIEGPTGLRIYVNDRANKPSITTQLTNLSEDDIPLISTKLEYALDHTELQSFALQIARGMAHLERIPLTHRDLAARNILINEHKQLKISDFGMSRMGPYINQKTKRIPLRWMAIESIDQNFTNSKSDVWSYGVVLWEIGTLAAFPYKGVSDQTLLYKLLQGHRLEMPRICTDELYSLMLKCWSYNPDDRPSFEELVDLLDYKKRVVYTDFKALDPKYVFPSAREETH